MHPSPKVFLTVCSISVTDRKSRKWIWKQISGNFTIKIYRKQNKPTNNRKTMRGMHAAQAAAKEPSPTSTRLKWSFLTEFKGSWSSDVETRLKKNQWKDRTLWLYPHTGNHSPDGGIEGQQKQQIYQYFWGVRCVWATTFCWWKGRMAYFGKITRQ